MTAYTPGQRYGLQTSAEQRLKNRLQGVGVDGGFLTSPVVVTDKLTGQSPFIGGECALDPSLAYVDSPNDYMFGPTTNTNAGLGMAGLQPSIMFDSNQRNDIKENRDPLQTQPSFLMSPPGTLRSRKIARDIGPLDMPSDIPLIQVDTASGPASPSMPRAKRQRRQLSVRTNGLSTAPSTPRTRNRTVTAPTSMTPVSSHVGNFNAFGNMNVPFNTPAQPSHPIPKDNAMPFTFNDLYSYGLVQGSMFDLGDLGSPIPGYKAMGSEAAMSDLYLGSPSPASATVPLPNTGDGVFDLGFLPVLPTPPLDGDSCLSSPATHLSASPMLSPTGSGYSSSVPTPLDFAGIGFNFIPQQISNTLVSDFTHLLDPTLTGQSRASSECYSPALSIPNSPLDTMAPSAALDAIAHTSLAVPTINEPPRLRHKRSRIDFEAEDDEEYGTNGSDDDFYGGESAGDDEYAPNQFLEQPTVKKQRVVSAPVVGRRLKPGPKPRKQPSFDGRRSISAGPGPAELIAQAMRNLGSDPEGEASDDNANEGTSSVPKSVIRSLYSTLPAHVAGKSGKKYRCLIEGCNRVFPRKSAIESHIQTHLEDKPFVCTHADCTASFVRQHDLRRHERIHSGNKPFPCPCGKGFARGDALMRHRQRGICIGSVVPMRG